MWFLKVESVSSCTIVSPNVTQTKFVFTRYVPRENKFGLITIQLDIVLCVNGVAITKIESRFDSLLFKSIVQDSTN